MLKMEKTTNLLTLAIFLFLTLILTYPLVLHPTGLLEIKKEGFPTLEESDVLQNIFKIGWHKKAISEGTSLLFTNRNYYPEGLTPAQDNFNPSYSLVGAMLSFFMPFYVAHNLLVAASIFLGGLGVYLLARETLKSESASLFSGTLYMCFPFAFYEASMGHSNIMQLQWIPLILLFTIRTLNNPDWRNTFFLGLFANLQFFSSTQITVYLVIMLGVFVLGQCVHKRVRQTINQKGVYCLFLRFSLVFLVLGSPYLYGFFSTSAVNTRPLVINRLDIFILNGFSELVDSDSQLFVGWVSVLLFCAALAYDIKRKNKFMIPYYILILAALLFALGPFAPYAPYTILYYFYIPVRIYRVPMRIMPFALVGFAVVGGYCLTRIQKHVKFPHRIITWAAIVLAFMSLVPFSPAFNSRNIVYPQNAPELTIYNRLSDSKEEFAVAEYPLYFCCKCAYHSLFHQKNLVGGCAAYPPQEYLDFEETCGKQMLDIANPICQKKIKDYGLRYVFFDSERYENWEEIQKKELKKENGWGFIEEKSGVNLYKIEEI
ncbi:MAG: glycosyltransferase family 39 protein [Candidatus Altiarchaeota archaeon]